MVQGACIISEWYNVCGTYHLVIVWFSLCVVSSCNKYNRFVIIIYLIQFSQDQLSFKGKNVHIENSSRIYCFSPIKTCHFFVALALNFIFHLKSLKNIEMRWNGSTKRETMYFSCSAVDFWKIGWVPHEKKCIPKVS